MFNFNLRKNYQPEQAQIPPVQMSASAQTLLEPKEIEINGIKFIISKMPCTVAQEVIFNMPAGLIPVISEFKRTEEQAFKMLKYCERIYLDGRPNVPLISKEIINNHIPNFDTLIKLEYECLKYNFDFFGNGSALTFFNQAASLVKSNISEILTDLLDKLSARGLQASGSLKPDIL